MRSKIAMFAVLSLAAVFAVVGPSDVAVAEQVPATDGEDGSHDEGYEGKTCPSKERKTASATAEFAV